MQKNHPELAIRGLSGDLPEGLPGKSIRKDRPRHQHHPLPGTGRRARKSEGLGKRLIRKEKSPGKRTAACRMRPRNGYRHFPARKVYGSEETS